MINEAVIIVGGMGTRLLPYTKTVTKEMLPIFDVPSIFLLVKEAYLSGIKKVIFVVTKRNKKLIENYFSSDTYLDNFIKDEPVKQKLLLELKKIIKEMKFQYVYETLRGSYGAVYSAKNYIKNDNFLVMYGDDIIDSKIPLTKQLIDNYQKTNSMQMAIYKPDLNDLPKSGLIKYDKDNNLIGITKLEESNKVIAIGRFILNKKIFKVKNQLTVYQNNELYLPHSLLHFKDTKCYLINGYYFNIGEKLGFIKASIHYALKNEAYRDEMLKFLKEINY